MKNKVIVVGANGQLGRCIKELVEDYLNSEFYFFSSKELDITLKKDVLDVFAQNNFDYCINCAAYTAVDKAELEQEKAFEVNVKGVENIAKACKINAVKLIHISSDFVFDGKANKPYTEECATNPLSVYGFTKLEGEKKIRQVLNEHMIIRTSWLYSQFKDNFVTKIVALSKLKNELKVVCDQIGSPTSAKDLAEFIIEVINSGFDKFGTYHFSNKGELSWYEFAKTIFDFLKIDVNLISTTSNEFNAIAKRPNYSVLDTYKIQSDYNICVKEWKTSLEIILKKLM